jgi:hypothetical protein
MRVRFLAHYRIWNAGELAGFPEDVGAVLVARGIAEAVHDAVPEEPPAADAEPAPSAPARRTRRAAAEPTGE